MSSKAGEKAPAPSSPDALEKAILTADAPLSVARDYLRTLGEWLDQRYLAREWVRQLIADRAHGVDALLQALWSLTGLEQLPGIGLLAVGGYGRAELHPHSDIDLLVLTIDEAAAAAGSDSIERFVTMLWDTGLDVGHSVRSLVQCREMAIADITVMTNLIESRQLAGDPVIAGRLATLVDPTQMWPSHDFFRAKREEQIARHRRFTNSEYNLEPNLKSCPGGLRDCQVIGWVAKRHFATRTIRELVAQGFLTAEEYDSLVEGQDFLWHLRYGLHMLAGRAEDRLLFDYQRRLAELFGFVDDERGLAVEHFMKEYYRWALTLGTLNEMLVQLLDEAILRACEPETIMEINRRFRIRNGYIEASHDRVFLQTPYALMEVFVLLAQHQNLDGIRASTIRLIREHCELIDDNFRSSARINQLFLKLLCSPNKVATQLRRMHRYGVLGRYIPEFGRIIGMMQHDLFHIYTVDAHTLQVFQNIRRFRYTDQRDEFPIAAQIMERLPRPELLYLAGLFHDLAKGRGGDHSRLGAEDAFVFCQRLALSKRESRLVAWLVEQHLVMSTISQRQDLSDPEVIQQFAGLVGDRSHLDHLYALTVADINATNPTLWNSWRASLMRTLYNETRLALRRGLENPVDKQELVDENRDRALKQLLRRGFNRAQIKRLWQHLGEDYFVRENVADIVWHSQAIMQHHRDNKPVVLIREAGNRYEGVSQIFLYTRDRPHLFATIAACLERLELDVQGARIYNSFDQHILDSFFVLENNGHPIGRDSIRIATIENTLRDGLSDPEFQPLPMHARTPRRLKHFLAATRCHIDLDPGSGNSLLEVVTTDRPGLLARIGRVFVDFGIQVHDARIATLGERVEDVFFISDHDSQALGEPLAGQFKTALCQALDSDMNN